MKTTVEGNRRQELRYFNVLIALDRAYGLSKAFYNSTALRFVGLLGSILCSVDNRIGLRGEELAWFFWVCMCILMS